MCGATEQDLSLLGPHQTECEILRDHPLNTLIEGPVGATDAVLLLLRPHFREPVASTRPDVPLDLPSGKTHTLILRDAGALSAGDQRRLLAWLGCTGSSTQVVSTAKRSLFELVDNGLFDAALYYRLNVVRLQVGSREPSELPSEDPEGAFFRFGNPITTSILQRSESPD
jgi:hypothetical protein